MIKKSMKEEKTVKTTRRKFCKKIPCIAMGIAASSSLSANLLKEYDITNESFNKQNINIMPNVITVKVISQKGSCGMHKVGDEIVITEEGVNGKICIHALYSFLPKVFAMMFDSKFPWLENPDVSTSACPDAYNPVVFEISREKVK